MNQPHPLDYETPRPKKKPAQGFNGWWFVVPLLIVALTCIPNPHGSRSVLIARALAWAYLAIGLRTVVGLVLDERNRTWIVYVAFSCLLPFLALGIAAIWR